MSRRKLQISIVSVLFAITFAVSAYLAQAREHVLLGGGGGTTTVACWTERYACGSSSDGGYIYCTRTVCE